MGSSWETRYLCVLSFARKHTLYCYNFSIRAQSTFPMAVIPSTSILNNRNKAYYCLSYPSYFGSKGAKDHESESILPSASGTGVPHTDDWVHMFNDSFQYLNHTLDSAYEKIKEIVEETSPHVNRLIQSHPYLGNVIAPIGCTLTATVLAWVVMPRVLRRVHKYTTQSPAVLLSKGFLWEQVPYERSMWAALEEPVRYLITFMAFSQIGEMVAPSTLASEYISKSWRGAVVLSFVWFLYRWKTYVFSHALAFQSMEAREREKLQTLDKLSSVGLFVLGLMALSEACGVAVQSIITVGGIGGVATAFAARDILGNVLSGLSMQFSKPFSLGDTIKAGSIEGQVAEMGLMTTVLLNSDKHPVIVPNSLFSSQGVKICLSPAATGTVTAFDYDMLHLIWVKQKFQKQIDGIDQHYDLLRRAALSALKSKNKKKALEYVGRMKLSGQNREKCTLFLNKVELVINTIRSAEATKEVSEAMRICAQFMKETAVGPEEIRLCLEEIKESMETQEQIHEVLEPSGLYSEVNYEDIEDEFKRMEEELLKQSPSEDSAEDKSSVEQVSKELSSLRVRPTADYRAINLEPEEA